MPMSRAEPTGPLRYRGLVAVALSAWSSVAIAADSSVAEALSKLRGTPAYQRTIFQTVAGTSAYKAATCKAAQLTMIGPTFIETVPTFDANGAPQSGDWGDRIVVAGCGPDHALNVLAHARGKGVIEAEPMLPGSTKASLQLQMDAISFAFDAARVDRQGCKPIYIFDTDFKAFFQPPNPAIPGKPWSERWTVQQCGKRTPVDMTFIPDRTGTSIGARTAP